MDVFSVRSDTKLYNKEPTVTDISDIHIQCRRFQTHIQHVSAVFVSFNGIWEQRAHQSASCEHHDTGHSTLPGLVRGKVINTRTMPGNQLV
jgi:hypothetical protein